MKAKKKTKRKVSRKAAMLRRIRQGANTVVKASDISTRIRTGALIGALTVVDSGWHEFYKSYFDALSESEGIAAILLSEKILIALGCEKENA
jgi:hypothetical protein